MKRFLCTLSLIASITAFSQDPFTIPPGAENFYNNSFTLLPSKQRQAIERFTVTPTTETSGDSIAARLKTLPVFQHFGPAALDSMAVYAMVRFSASDLSSMKGLSAQMKRSEYQQRTQPTPAVTRAKPAPQSTEERKRVKTAAIEETLDIKMQRLIDRRTAMNDQLNLLMQRIAGKPTN